MRVLFYIIQLLSIGFCLLTLWRLFLYINRYKFDETKYTLLLGFIHLRWIAAAYFVLTIGWAGVSYALFNYI